MACWDGHRDYFVVKKRKLDEQLEKFGGARSSIFSGVTIYVNGYTQPDSDTLKELIYVHGGLYEYTPSSLVTHVIASNLPIAKIKKLSQSAIVCTPQWITDSIAKNKLLPVASYELYNVLGKSQSKLEFSPMTSLEATEHKENNEADSAFVTCTPSTNKKHFVNNYYSHSRLHYLSTWSAELREFTSKILLEAKQKLRLLPPSLSLRKDGTRAICHVDVDCFFVSVSIQSMPHLKGKPVAVTHASNRSLPVDCTKEIHLQDSTSDIASCSYEARKYGICNGMSVGTAIGLCPELVLVPYNFKRYRQVSQVLYETVMEYSHMVQAVSCDEMFVEFTDYAKDFSEVNEIVTNLRADMEKKTNCTVSVGISYNMMLSRVATKQAKPNGQFYLAENQVKKHLYKLPVKSLPGVGFVLTGQLKNMSVTTCGDLLKVSLSKLQEVFGAKTGQMLYHFARGIDERDLCWKTQRKSISVDINYGMRFTELSEAESVLQQLAQELHTRAVDAKVEGTSVCLKMKIRKPDSPLETWKYLGHGPCQNVSCSSHLLTPTNSSEELCCIVIKLLKQMNPSPSDIRGMGIQLNRLVSQSSESPSKSKIIDVRTMMNDGGSKKSPCKPEKVEPMNHETSLLINLPPASQLDMSVLLALPPNLQEEVFDSYNHDEGIPVGGGVSVSSLPMNDSTIDSEDLIDDIRVRIKDWVTGNLSGPSPDDRKQMHEFLLQLSNENLELTDLAMKCFRRNVYSVASPKLTDAFNNILTVVQTTIYAKFHGKLQIDSIQH